MLMRNPPAALAGLCQRHVIRAVFNTRPLMSAPVTEGEVRIEIHDRKHSHSKPERQPFNYRLVAFGVAAVLLAGLFHWYMNREPASKEPPELRRITQAERKKDVATIAAAVKDPDATVAVRAVDALGNIGDPSLYQHLQPALRDNREQVREAAMRNYAFVGDRNNVQAVSSALSSDASPAVRMAAASTLGALRTTSEPALQSLIRGLYDRDSSVRLASISALQNIFAGIRFNYDFRLSANDPKNAEAIAAIRKAAAQWKQNVEMDVRREQQGVR
jgi:HEAT repeat protein